MKKMLLFSILSLAVSSAYAKYQVIIQLDPNGIIMAESPIVGNISLTPTTINRGESSTISWNYDYANNINIKGLGFYGKNGTLSVSPLASRNYEIEITKGTQKKIENLYLNVIQPNQNISFSSNINRVGVGQPITLNWEVANATSVDIDNGVGTNLPLVGNSIVYPTVDTTFKLTAKGYEGVSDVNEYLTIDVVNNSVINSFNASSLNITKGNSVTFNWDVSDSEGLTLLPYGAVSGIPTGNQTVDFSEAGFYDFTLRSLSLNGTQITSTPIGINVYNPAIINSYTINGSSATVDVSPNDTLNFAWTSSDAVNYKLNGNTINGVSTSLVAASSVGTTAYVLEAFNGAGDSVNSSISVNVVGLPTIDSIIGPNNVFSNTPLSLSWSGVGISRYEIKSNNSNSGIPLTSVDLGSSTSTNVTPTIAGTYVYTVSAYNTANSKVDSTKSITVEADPSFTGFTVNGQTVLTVSPNTELTFAGAGFSTGATLAGRNSSNSATLTLPSVSSATAGTTSYYASATKSLNSITRYSALRNVDVIVVNNPTIGTITAPTNVFANASFNMSWSGTNVTNYKIRGNVAASGVATTDVDLTTSTSRAITPTAAGTYTYTITATNAAGVTETSTSTVVVEADPTFTGFTVNSGTTATVAPTSSLTFTGTGYSSGATLQGRNSAGTANATLPASAAGTAGTTTYYASATKSLNSVTRYSALRSVSVTVVDAPVLGAITAPTNVFANATLNMSWSGTNVVNYKIKGNVAASGISTTDVDLGSATSTSITPTAAGTYTYTITATNAAGVTSTATSTIVVEADPTFTGFTVNGSTTASVAPSATLTFLGTGFSSGSSIQGRNVGNTSNVTLPATASASAGTTTYYGAASKTLNSVIRYSALRSVDVTVVNNPTMDTSTAPTNVFANAAFTMSWTGTGATSYRIRSNAAASGISTTDIDLGAVTSRSITPTAAGTYTYTISAVNSIGSVATRTQSVIVESDPTISNLRINNGTTPNVMPGVALTPTSTVSSGATMVENVPATAPANVGPYTYTYSSTKTLNGVTRNSASSTIVLDVGIFYDIVVGRYGDSPFGYGYLSSATGWTVHQAGSISNNQYNGTDFLAVYTTGDNPGHVYVNFVGTNGLYANKQLRINGVLCSQTTAVYDYLGGIDTYQYHSCSSGMSSKVGQTVRYYTN